MAKWHQSLKNFDETKLITEFVLSKFFVENISDKNTIYFVLS